MITNPKCLVVGAKVRWDNKYDLIIKSIRYDRGHITYKLESPDGTFGCSEWKDYLLKYYDLVLEIEGFEL